MNKHTEKISKTIKATWPGAEIRVIRSDRDHIGPLYSVRNKTNDGLDKLRRSLEHIVVELDHGNGYHVLVIPMEPVEPADMSRL